MSGMRLSRRDFTAGAIAAPAVLNRALGAALAEPRISPDDVEFAHPGTTLYARYQPVYNQRTELRPALRALCRTERGVQALIDWVRTRNIPFAIRSGGHSFEGLSQSESVVIDTRPLNEISYDARSGIISVGGGVSLGAVYAFVAANGLAFPAGSCPTVGLAGHALGGGYGLLARSRGLACDVITAVELVDAEAKLVRADATRNPDLFWACRGGGGGSFGVVTRFHARVEPIGNVVVFNATWAVTKRDGARLFDAWQRWAPHAPDTITGLLKISGRRDGRLSLHVAGQSTGTAAQVHRELRALTDIAEPAERLSIRTSTFFGAVDHFSGGWDYESKYSKGKSDFITRPMNDAGIEALLGGIAAASPGAVIAICDAYGGAISRVANDATAFAYREGTQYCIQYYTSWQRPGLAARRLAELGHLYAGMRPFSDGAYVNYCDTDLPDWRHAYWRHNLPRLEAVKAKFDPSNLFRHAQSI